MKKTILITLALCCITTYVLYSQSVAVKNVSEKGTYTKALVDYNDFKALVTEVENHRAERLVSLDDFLSMSKEDNVIILDTRSDSRYNRKHIKGALHLDFTDFTQENLLKLIPDVNTKILIYCNNNFSEDQIDFATKKSGGDLGQTLPERKPIMLALNIPTYINLYGYGYRNIYELDELVNVKDKRIEFEGTAVK
jgi:rhodanese-related sulfurtransferase